ncbi:MAG: tRNA pseudouridine(38-40) synthase TruA [Halioglobus sp.]
MANSFQQFSSESLAAGTRIACCIEYNGSDYCGWQAQPQLDVSTVQQQVEQALSAIACEPIRVHCAGRTDTGVHATSQIIHFDAPVVRSTKAWVLGANANLPFDVRVRWAVAVAPDFHARFTALSRRYRYLISNAAVRSALFGSKLTWQRRPLDAQIMQEEAQCLPGEQDFSAFRAACCQSVSPMRNVHEVKVTRRGELVIIDITANAFLHHMVRNLAGSLMAVGSGRRPAGWMAEILAGRDRTLAAETAPPNGLYLVHVAYPDEYALPTTPAGPLFLPD